MLYERFRVFGAAAILVLTVASSVHAENISVDPLEWDFGNVEIGTSQSVEFKLDSLGPTPLTITNVNLIAGSPSPFLLTVGLPGTTILLPGEYVSVEVSFLPIALGLFEADLNVLSDAASGNDNLFLPLRGTGVRASAAVPEPSLLLLLASGLIVLAVACARHPARK